MDVAPQEKANAPRRDGLGQACFLLHLAILVFVIFGWTADSHTALIFYLIFLPGMVLHWRLNRNACVLNNLEALIRTGCWRDPSNREEGAWLVTLVRDVTGLPVTAGQMDAVTHSVLALLWGLAWWHLRGW